MSETSRLFLRLLPAALPLCLASAPADAVELLRPRPLMEYHDVMLAQELDTALAVLNSRTAQCVGSGEASPEACACRFPAETSVATASYDKVLQARPSWKGKVLYWKNPNNHTSHQIVMPALEHQLITAQSACHATPAKD